MAGQEGRAADPSALFPARMVVDDPAQAEAYLVEERGLFRSRPAAILAPASRDDLCEAVRICAAAGLKIVPQGGNTGLCGGAVAEDAAAEVILSTRRLPKEAQIDPVEQTGLFSASMTILEAKQAAQERGLDLPLSYGSEGSATVGGGIATNAGGMDAIRYGVTRSLVRGVEVVLADGSVLDLLRGLQKDNTGYDLRNLFIGSEGTLGIVTRAHLQLVPLIAQRSTALVAVASMQDALAVLGLCRARLGPGLLRLECMARAAYELVFAQVPDLVRPLAEASDWLLFIEAGSPAGDLAEATMALLDEIFAQGLAVDGVLSQSLAQTAGIWAIRERIIEAQKTDGSSIKHDVALPVARLPEFLAAAAAIVEAVVPGARPVPFGHLGDGNIHYNVQQPPGARDQAFLDRWHLLADEIHGLVVSLGGSFSAEHGIGRLKTADMARFKSATELLVMHRIKQALDPGNLFNPGKVLPPDPAA